ncbi:endo-alpha-N-acetylgalactosaminidase family protein [Robinsoniella peoriensis]|uniref:endo-alpha-N-acetylgalactosaminidase family protein n=1 Tax=Robinsoniella peoriensis TaxID=180332 RepID=UPI00374FE4F9
MRNKRNLAARIISFTLSLCLVCSSAEGLFSSGVVHAAELQENGSEVMEIPTETEVVKETELQSEIPDIEETESTSEIDGADREEAATEAAETESELQEKNAATVAEGEVSADEAFAGLLDEMYAAMPAGQEKVTYGNNYQSNQPEPFTYKSGKGTATVDNGLTMKIESLTGNEFAATWDNTPYLTSGVISTVFKYQSEGERIGFLIKANDDSNGISVRYDVKGTWNIQSQNEGGKWKTFSGPVLEQNTEYRLRIGFYGDKIIIALDDAVIFNESVPNVLTEELINQRGQIGIFKWFNVPATVSISDFKVEGVGTKDKPSNVVEYVQDYEDPEYTPNWSNNAASIETTDTGNRVLKIAAGKARVVDLDSPDIKEGTLSLRYKAVAPANSTPKQFGFRFGAKDNKFRELNWDGGQWVVENQSGYPSIDMQKPVNGTWNDLIINFQEGSITVYLNKEPVGTFTLDVLKNGVAGQFGIRTWGSTAVLIDDVIYTNKIIEPEAIVKYENDFQDGITGTWSQGSPAIVKEGSNKVLSLTNVSGMAELTDAVKLSQGTYGAKVKTEHADLGLKIGTGIVQYNVNKWEFVLEDQTYPLTGEAESPKLKAWNDLAVSFTGDKVTLSINGKKSAAEIPAGVSIGMGYPGITGTGKIYLDDLLYTEKFEDISTAPLDKVYYEEYYDTIAAVNWEEFETPQIKNGYLEGAVAGNAAAVNSDISMPEHGVFQVKMQADQLKSGIQIGNLKVYNTSATEWVLDNGSEITPLGISKAIAADADYILRVEIVKGNLTLKVNNQTVGTANEVSYDKTQGGFGIYNPNAEKMNVKIDAMGAEELSVYEETFGDLYNPTWESSKPLDNSNNAIHNIEAGTLTIKVPGVTRFLNKDSIPMKDVHTTFDFTPSVGDDMQGGRYGFVFRDTDFTQGLSVEVDINGNWRVNVDDSTKGFGKTFSLKAGETYKVAIDLIGNTVQLKFTDKDGLVTDMGSVTMESMKNTPGLFGIKSWYGSKELTFDNFEMIEEASLPLFSANEKTVEIQKDGLTAMIDQSFPRILSYKLNEKTMRGQEDQLGTVVLNGEKVSPAVTGTKKDDSTYEYVMEFADKGVTMKATLSVAENHVVEFKITDIAENGSFKVKTFSLGESTWAYADDKMEGASYAWTKSNGQWHGVSEELADDMSQMEKSGAEGTTMAMISGNGLAASIENNVMSGGNKVVMEKSVKSLVKKAQIRNGEWTYRYSDTTDKEELPWAKIVITEDANADENVDWQDAAVAHRKYILEEAFGAKDMANNMMYIAFNFASQANDPFLNSLETGKVLYNYMDGFGQMVLHKGYQAEGHDDDIPSYSNVGVRQGGVEDFKTLIGEGDKYNMSIGVHLNATEYHLDANELYYKNLSGATAAGYQSDRLAKGWDWIDTAYYVDQTKDVVTGQLQKRFKDLYDLTKVGDKGLDFYYIDVYTGNDYNAYKLVDYINDLGVKVGTEFSGPIEPGVTFTHWGTDLGYPNKGNKSVLYRMVKNDLDIFVGNALFKGQKIPVVTTWGDSKTDVQQGVTVFYNEVLPTKFMQHFGVLKSETDQITFEGNVTSTRNKETKMVELRQDGKLISSWADTGTTTDEGERHAGEATSLIPWSWDIKTGDKLDINGGAKLYHWNTTGNSTTWELTDEFKNVPSFDLYETTQQGKVKIGTTSNDGGTITINSKKNTPYVLYPSTSTHVLEAAGNWGEGSPAKDFAFNAEKFADEGGVWEKTGDASIEVVPGKVNYDISKEMSENRWDRYAQFKTEGGTLSQEMTDLEPGQDYTVGVWTETQNGRKASIEVTIGDQTYTNFVTGKDGVHRSSFKYVGTRWQRMDVEFTVPEGVTTAQIKLTAEKGDGVVNFDDVKVWQHTTKENDVNNSDYVLYEDFENTYEGWGPLEYGGGSRKIHIASDRSNANDNNEIVKPGEDKVGPVMTWVLDGENSLKLNENEVGRYVVTNESSLKLQPNTSYDLTFDYTLEDGCDYVVYVKPVSQGAEGKLAFKDHENATEVKLKHTPTSGDKKTKSTFNGTFTTGDAEDYQIYFYEKAILKPTDSNPTSAYALILDNIGVKTSDSDMKDQLQQLYDANKDLKEADYTAQSWKVFKAALDAAKEALGSQEATVAELKEAYDALEKAAADLVKYGALDELIKQAEAINAGEYTANSYARLASALENAKKVDRKDQEAVDAATKNLNDAINGLVKIVEAQSALTEAKKVVQGNYTKDSYTTLQNAIKEVENLIANSVDLTQAKLDAAVVRMTAAQKSLVKVVQKNVVDSLRTIYNAYNGKDAAYTSNSFAAMKQVLARIEKVLADTSNVSEKEGSDLLVQAKAAESQLVKRADKTKLNSAYQSAKAISFSKYTDKTVKAVKDLFSQIDAVMANANADQKTVDALYNKLNQAVKGLVKKSITSVKLNVKKKTLGEKEKFKLTVKLKPSGVSAGTLKWSSSNKKIVTVDKKGRITAKKPGTAKITVKTANKKSAYCTITVKKKPKSVKLVAKSDSLKVNKTMKLKTTLSKGSAGKVTYTYRNPKVATVSASGKVKALKKGRVKITVKTYNNKNDYVKLKIVK